MANLGSIQVGAHAQPTFADGRMALYMTRETFMKFKVPGRDVDSDIFHNGQVEANRGIRGVNNSSNASVFGISDTFLWSGEGFGTIDKSYATGASDGGGLYWHDRDHAKQWQHIGAAAIPNTNVSGTMHYNHYVNHGKTGFAIRPVYGTQPRPKRHHRAHRGRSGVRWGRVTTVNNTLWMGNVWSFVAPWEGYFQWYAGQSVMWWTGEITDGTLRTAPYFGGNSAWWNFHDARGLTAASSWQSKVTGNNNHYLTPPIKLRKGGKILFTCTNTLGSYTDASFTGPRNYDSTSRHSQNLGTVSSGANYTNSNTGGAGTIIAYFSGPPKPPTPPILKGGTAKGSISMSQLAIRGGKGTYRFPANWYGYTKRHGETAAGVQGWMGWRYGYATHPGGDQTVTWYNPATQARNGHLFRGNSGVSIFPFMNVRGDVHPMTGMLNVIRWRAGKGGRMRFYGFVSDTNSGGGDGVTFWLAKMKSVDGKANGSNVAEFVIPPTGTQQTAIGGRHFNTVVSMRDGDCFYLVVGPNNESSYDSTNVTWNMYYEDVNFQNTHLSLREMTEDMGRYQVVMPNYRPSKPGMSNRQLGMSGQNLSLQNKFSDRGELSTIPMSQWVDTTFVPEIQRTASSHDTAYYANQGNGMLQVRVAFNPGGAQWWSSGGTVTSSQLRLINLAPPSGVSFINNVERDWTYSGAGSGGAKLSAKFDGLVGGLYGVEGKINWTTPNGGSYAMDISDTGDLPGWITFVQRGLTSYAI